MPPAVTCPVCGRGECAGCAAAAVVVSSTTPNLAWETRAGSWIDRLFRTALSSSTEPERIFGELADGRLGPALAFAAIAEALAIGSFAGAAMLSLLAIAPDVAMRTLADPLVLWLLGATAVIAVVVMLVLHALWGLCLELGARGTERGSRFTHGLRFGLYACGWDLLTSPAGVLQGLFARGPRRAWPPIARASQAPRIAMRAYLERCRQLDSEAQRRGKKFTLLLLAAAFLGICAGLAVLFLELFVAA